MLNLLLFIVLVGLLVHGISLLPLKEPFQQVVLVVGVIAVLLACLQVLLGVSIGGFHVPQMIHQS